jgi:hypothetical protein
MFAYPCPFCTQRLLASPERIGQRTICPKCLKPIVIARPESAPPLSGELSVAELLNESKATIFVGDDAQASDEADAMDLSLPADYGERLQQSEPDYSPLPPLSDADLAPLTAEASVALAVAEEPSSDTTLGLLPMAYAGIDTPVPSHTPAPQAAPAQLGGLGAGPAAFVPAALPTPAVTVPATSPTPPTVKAPNAPTPVPGRAALHPPKPATTPTPKVAKDAGVVVFHSTDAESADIAAELTTNLTMRMKPPPEPPSDLRLTTGLWLLLTAAGMSLWLLSCMSPERGDTENFLLTCVKYIGALEVMVSYVWVAYLCGRRDTNKGLAALVPPVWLYHLVNPHTVVGYRPLRYAVAGALLLCLAFGAAALRPYVHRFIGPPPEAAPTIPSPLASPLARLKNAELGGTNRQLAEALADLAKDEVTFVDAPAETPGLIQELRRFRTHDSGEVRGAALIALKKWAGLTAAKADVLSVLRAKAADDRERIAALTVAREYKDREIARAVALRVGFRGFNADSQFAADTLRAIGRPEAEEALLELFDNEDLLIRGLPQLLADPQIGGPHAVAVLREKAEKSASREVRESAIRTADAIAITLRDAKPSK